MKKYFVLAVMAIMLTVAFVSCNNVDPVHGTQPVTNAFYTDANGNENFPLGQFHRLGEAGDTVAQRELLDQYRKVLTANVIRQYPQIIDENNIHFVLGSGFAKDVRSGDGRTYSGRFKNELIIILNDPFVHDTLFLACGNGMLSPLRFYYHSYFGSGDPWIEVRENDSYARFFPDTWGKLAKDADVGIRNSKGEKVTPRIYLQWRGKYTSMLRTGDKVNLITGEVRDENGMKVDFDSRQRDTKEANAAEKAKVQKAKAQKAKAKSTKRPNKRK